MVMLRCMLSIFIILFWPVLHAMAASPDTHKITFINNCSQTIWVGQTGSIVGTATTVNDGWEMAAKSGPVVKTIPVNFSGRWWPRTGCTFNSSGKCPTQGVNCCASGGCITSDPTYFGLQCTAGGEPPVSLFEVTLDAVSGNGPIDYLDLSMVDGFSVPMKMVPDSGTYNPKEDNGMDPTKWCQTKGWVTNPTCPTALWDDTNKVCWGPCAYYTHHYNYVNPDGSIKTNKANICCDNSNVDPTPNPSSGKKCENQTDDFAGGFGCSPYGPCIHDDEKCYAKDSGKHGYWGAIVDTDWPDINKSAEYITNVNTGVPGVYAWQFDDLNSTFNCRKTGGAVDYTITFCPDH